MKVVPKVSYPQDYKLHKLQNREFTDKCLAIEKSELTRGESAQNVDAATIVADTFCSLCSPLAPQCQKGIVIHLKES